MSVDNSTQAAQAAPGSTYGRVIRERGTLKVLILAAVLTVAWLVYSTIHTHLMNQVKWPALTADLQGLTVLGLQDKDRPGWRHKYEAIERGHAWIFRRPDDLEAGADEGSETKPEDADRGNNPGARVHVSQGEIVDVSEIIANCPVVLTGKHFTGASIEERTEALMDRHYSVVTVHLSDEGRSRYWQFSSKHPKERLVFLLGGQPLTCPRMDTMDVSTLEIQPIWDKADAERLADFINKQGK